MRFWPADGWEPGPMNPEKERIKELCQPVIEWVKTMRDCLCKGINCKKCSGLTSTVRAVQYAHITRETQEALHAQDPSWKKQD
ncbi:MAG: hypothetical protein ACTSSE_13100 [Candidatus Thorarchaeota archaeon]